MFLAILLFGLLNLGKIKAKSHLLPRISTTKSKHFWMDVAFQAQVSLVKVNYFQSSKPNQARYPPLFFEGPPQFEKSK